MLDHLNNILHDIDTINNSNNYNLENIDLSLLKNKIIYLKENLDKNINLENVKSISKIIYELNTNNMFSTLTDHISNEFYAFEFLLENKIRKENYNGWKK